MLNGKLQVYLCHDLFMCVCSVLTEQDYSPLSHPVTFALSLHKVLIFSFTQEKDHNQVGGLSTDGFLVVLCLIPLLYALKGNSGIAV